MAGQGASCGRPFSGRLKRVAGRGPGEQIAQPRRRSWASMAVPGAGAELHPTSCRRRRMRRSCWTMRSARSLCPPPTTACARCGRGCVALLRAAPAVPCAPRPGAASACCPALVCCASATPTPGRAAHTHTHPPPLRSPPTLASSKSGLSAAWTSTSVPAPGASGSSSRVRCCRACLRSILPNNLVPR